MNYCKNCGAELKDGMNFCTICGAPQMGNENQQVNPTQQGTTHVNNIEQGATNPNQYNNQQPHNGGHTNSSQYYQQQPNQSPYQGQQFNGMDRAFEKIGEGLTNNKKTGKVYMILGWVFAAVSLLFIPILFGALAVVMGFLYRSYDQKHGTIIMIMGAAFGILGMLIGMIVASGGQPTEPTFFYWFRY